MSCSAGDGDWMSAGDGDEQVMNCQMSSAGDGDELMMLSQSHLSSS